MMMSRPFFALLTGVLLFIAACDSEPTGQLEISVLRVGIVPDESLEVLQPRYVPMFEYLARVLEIPYEYVPSETYDDLVTQFVAGRIDLAYFGGLTFLRAEAAGKAVPIVMRDVDKKFTSYFLVRADDPAIDITDFKGKKFCFGSRLSTSGHLMPRNFLIKRGIKAEEFFGDVCYSGAHDRTANKVRDGHADLGVANAQVILSMFAEGRLSPKDLRVLWQTPPYPNYVWAVRADLAPETRQRIRDAFLDLSPGDDDGARLLTRLRAGAFLPASPADYAPLRKIAEAIGLLGDGA
jgi:phosphonate transport system substrate-binding protein